MSQRQELTGKNRQVINDSLYGVNVLNHLFSGKPHQITDHAPRTYVDKHALADSRAALLGWRQRILVSAWRRQWQCDVYIIATDQVRHACAALCHCEPEGRSNPC